MASGIARDAITAGLFPLGDTTSGRFGSAGVTQTSSGSRIVSRVSPRPPWTARIPLTCTLSPIPVDGGTGSVCTPLPSVRFHTCSARHIVWATAVVPFNVGVPLFLGPAALSGTMTRRRCRSQGIPAGIIDAGRD